MNTPVLDASFSRSQAVSLTIHITVIALLFAAGSNRRVREAVRQSVGVVAPVFLTRSSVDPGGGGDRSPLPARQGRLPRVSPQQLTPPFAIVNNLHPRLIEEPTILGEQDAAIPNIDVPQYGDPRAPAGPPSNGPGARGGIGSGCCGGVGSNIGRGYGDQPVSLGGREVFRPGVGGVTMPKVIYKLEPEFSEDARKAKYQGVVRLFAVVDVDGRAKEIRVTGPLGMGLDEKAIEAVRQWRFQPGTKNGKAVPVSAVIEVNFRLL